MARRPARPALLAALLAAALLAAVPARPGEAESFPAGWAVPQAGTDANWAVGVALDDAGNVYAGGTFWGQVEFDPDPLGLAIRTAYGYSDAYVAKYTPDGDLLWAGTLSGNGYEELTGIAVDGDGAVYATGTFTGTVDFDPGAAVLNITSAGKHDGFVVKLDTTGALAWARTFGGPEDDFANAIDLERFVDGSGARWRVWVAGGFAGTPDFDPGPTVYPLISHGSNDAFVLRLNPDGYFIWAVQAGGTGYDDARGLATDGTRAFVTGEFQGTADFDPGMGEAFLTSAGGTDDAFAWMLNGNGTYGWAERIGGDSSDGGSRVAADHDGSIFVFGAFQGTLDVDLPDGYHVSLTSKGTDDLFLVKMADDGTAEWARSLGGTGFDTPLGIDLGPGDGIYLAGSFEETADFDPFPGGFVLTAKDQVDAFAVRLDSSGFPTQGTAIGGVGIDRASGIAVDAGGFVHLAGGFSGTADFDPGPGVADLTSQGQDDGFVAKMDLTGPDVTVSFPQQNGMYLLGQPLAVAYTCSDGATGLADCTATVDGTPISNGDSVDTSTPGVFAFAATATDNSGNSTTVVHIYKVYDTCAGREIDIYGTQGDDVLTGTQGDDVIAGYGGDDVILGREGNDVVCGGDGDDDIRGGSGADELYGENGNDRLRGASGDDYLSGGPGSDRLIPETGSDFLDGGPGSDIADYLAGKGPIVVALPAGYAEYNPPGEHWIQSLYLIEKVDGTAHDDWISGDGKRNVLRGKHGDDEIYGAGGNDDLIGGIGNDELHGEAGDDLVKGQGNDDRMYGEDGSDRLVGGSGDDHLFGGPGDDVLIGGLKIHFGTYTNEIDGGDGLDTCRWAHDGPVHCEP